MIKEGEDLCLVKIADMLIAGHVVSRIALNILLLEDCPYQDRQKWLSIASFIHHCKLLSIFKMVI